MSRFSSPLCRLLFTAIRLTFRLSPTSFCVKGSTEDCFFDTPVEHPEGARFNGAPIAGSTLRCDRRIARIRLRFQLEASLCELRPHKTTRHVAPAFVLRQAKNFLLRRTYDYARTRRRASGFVFFARKIKALIYLAHQFALRRKK